MLIEQIIELESRVLGLLVVHILKTSYFHDKTKIFKGKSSCEWFNAKNVAENNVPWFPWLGQVTKFNPKMQDFKRVLDLTWSKGRDLFNWFLNLNNFVLSNDSENVRNVIQMALNKPFFLKNKNWPNGWVVRPQTPIASGGWWNRSQAPSVTRLNCTNLLTTPPNFGMLVKFLTCGFSLFPLANPGYELNQTPSFWSFILCPIKSLYFRKFLKTSLLWFTV